MTESELRKKINANTAQWGKANDTAKALLQSENENLAKQLDSLTGGQSAYDPATNTWNLSASNMGAVERALEMRQEIENSAYGGYDPTKDPQYSTLKKQYLREADRGTENTMGIYSGITGGMPSTAAVTAAQQAGDYYRSQLADRQVALAEQDYNRYLAELSQKNTLYSEYTAAAEASAQQLAALGDFSAMGKLYGWSDDQIKKAEAAWAASQYSGRGGGGGSGGGSGNSNYVSAFSKSNASGAYRYGNTPGAGFTDAEYTRFIDSIQRMRTQQGQYIAIEDAVLEGKITDAQANALLQKYGISNKQANEYANRFSKAPASEAPNDGFSALLEKAGWKKGDNSNNQKVLEKLLTKPKK